MVIHVKHTSIASRAMMASLWLEYVAHQTITPTLVLRITQMEAPKDWHLSRISSHSLDERPNQHEKQQVEKRKQYAHV